MPDIEKILRQLAHQLRPSHSRTIRLGEPSRGGDFHITQTTIIISKSHATTGDPIEMMSHILDEAEAFDRREEEERRRHIKEAKKKAASHLGYLMRTAPDEVSPLLSQLLQEERNKFYV